jgi:hypothetical protein
MLDVPCLSLCLSAVACFLSACERGSWVLAAVSGIMLGLAMQTKYTALMTPLTILWAAWCRRREERLRSVELGLVAVVTSVALFVTWETFVTARYGCSHFLHHVAQLRTPWPRKLNMFWPFISLLGGVGAPLGLLAGVAWRVPGRWVVGAGVAYVAGLALLAALPGSDYSPESIRSLVFGASGIMTAVLLAMTAMRLLVRGSLEDGQFLAGWWLVEVTGSFVLSPWPAARRVLGTVVVGTIVSGHLARRTCRTPSRRRLVRGVALAGAVLGLLVQAIDIDNATAERDAVEQVADWLGANDPTAPIWFVGHWGLQFYAERAGWRSVNPDHSQLSAGSWLVIPTREVGCQRIDLPPQAVHVRRFDRPSRWPLSTIPWYHGTNTALRTQMGPILSLDLHWILADCVPRTPADGGLGGP